MEIDALDDFDVTYHTTFDFVAHSWNGHDVKRIADLGMGLHEKIGQMHRTSNSSLANRAGVTNLVPSDLGQMQAPKETVAPCSNAITSPISLNQLLSLDYLNQEILQIPFTLPVEIACLPSFFELPENISLEIFNPELLANYYPPSFDPLFSQYYQGHLLAEYDKTFVPLVELTEAVMITVAHAKDLSNAFQDTLAVLKFAEAERAVTVAIAKEKANIAVVEHNKAIGSVIEAQEAAKPPPIPPRGFACEPFQVTYERWLANKTRAVIAAKEQAKIAADALIEAKSSVAMAVEKAQTVGAAVKLAQVAVQAATKARAAAETIVEATTLASTFLPETEPFYPQVGLDAVCGKEYVSSLYQQFGLPDPFAEPCAEVSQSIALQEKENFAVWLESAGIRTAKYYSSHGTIESLGPSYPKFTQNDEPNSLRLSDEESVTWALIESYFKDGHTAKPIGPFANYASMLSSNKLAGPFEEVPLLGDAYQSTIHFHCGIGNNFASVVEGGLCLNKALDKSFAIQPHLIHSNSVAKGLLFVFLEKTKTTVEELKAAGVPLDPTIAAGLPAFTLERSHIQESIVYEVESLTKIAQNILARGNPNLKQVHVTFSNGGYVFKEALKQLPPEYRDTIIVIPVGSTAIIENDLAHMVYNVIGDKDWPSLTCNGGMNGIEAAKQKGANVEIIPQTETQTGIGGHYFMQPEYQQTLSELIQDEISEIYEIY